MEILKYKKLKNNLYEVYLSNGLVLKLYDETIIKYSLLGTKKITEKELDQITNDNDGLDAYYLALKYMSNKMRATKEIKTYLAKKEFSPSTIDKTIILLKQKGYLNEGQYLTSYINDEIILTNNGPEKIKYNLIKLGFKENQIQIDYDFSDKIKNLIAKKVKLNHRLSLSALKINITSYLINLGYQKDLFISYLETIEVDDQKMLKKDYEILFKKYHQKYDERKLKLMIRDKLFRKGYSTEAINEVMQNEDLY